MVKTYYLPVIAAAILFSGCSAKLVEVEQTFSESAWPALDTLRVVMSQARKARYEASLLGRQLDERPAKLSAQRAQELGAALCNEMQATASHADVAIEAALGNVERFQRELDLIATTEDDSLALKSRALLQRLGTKGNDAVDANKSPREVDAMARCRADVQQIVAGSHVTGEATLQSLAAVESAAGPVKSMMLALNQLLQVLEKERRAKLLRQFAQDNQEQVMLVLQTLNDSGAVTTALAQSRRHQLINWMMAADASQRGKRHGHIMRARTGAAARIEYERLLKVDAAVLMSAVTDAYRDFFIAVDSYPEMSPDQLLGMLGSISIIDSEVQLVREATQLVTGNR